MCNLLIAVFCGKLAEAIELGEKEKLEIPGGLGGVFKDPLKRKFQGVGGSKVKNLPWGGRVWIFSGTAHCRPRQFQVNRDFRQGGRRKYDGETSEGVLCSFAYFSLVV